MIGKYLPLALAILAISVMAFLSKPAQAFERTAQKPAIVLAAFGTTEPEALASILNIRNRVAAAFPGYDIHLAFTSNIIRDIWHKRAGDRKFKKDNPGIPAEIYSIKNSLSVLAGIQEEGARLVLVQSLHVTDGEEFNDLAALVKALSNYETEKPVLKPFPWIGLGGPALGVGDGRPEFIGRAVAALAPLAQRAKDSGSALVLMGHGNEHKSQKVYSKLESALRKAYGPDIYLGTVESPPHAEEILAALKKNPDGPKSLLLAPLMIVAGDHARNDMAGDEEDSWASVFKAGGYQVSSHLVGLGSNDSWADIYVERLKALAPEVLAKKAKDEQPGK
jgi:sirohydrochlorin cobaltochelatase